ncbi:unnamed protein product [Prorocentrum cordatum]|uniref:Thioredoxin domain-containing protein n=1 Tax=Prorocentrum cordatum TaxID=2364126 RepID=A0ABN9V889_9DINO|nr:unnamed protein product [Polarella glacialis]
MAAYRDSSDIIVGDVDCTASGKKLCGKHGVRGYPTILHGDPSSPEGMAKYQGQRSYAALSAFAAGLKPQCGPTNVVGCKGEDKAFLESIVGLSGEALKSKGDELKAAVEMSEKAVEAAIAEFESLRTHEKLLKLATKMPMPGKEEL